MKAKKNAREMTFKEFFEKAKREGIEDVESVEDWVSRILREEGFSDKEINKMKMKKVSNLFFDSLSASVRRDMDSFGIFLKYILPALYESKPETRPIFDQSIKDVTKMMKELTMSLERINKELEDELKKKEREKGKS